MTIDADFSAICRPVLATWFRRAGGRRAVRFPSGSARVTPDRANDLHDQAGATAAKLISAQDRLAKSGGDLFEKRSEIHSALAEARAVSHPD